MARTKKEIAFVVYKRWERAVADSGNDAYVTAFDTRGVVGCSNDLQEAKTFGNINHALMAANHAMAAGSTSSQLIVRTVTVHTTTEIFE